MYFQVYDGDFINMTDSNGRDVTQEGSYTESFPPGTGTFLSSGETFQLLFVSDMVGSDRGFEISYDKGKTALQ